MKQKNLLFRLPPCGRELILFLHGMLVKRITRAVEECKLDITLACFLCKSTLRTSSVIGGHPPPNKIIGRGSAPPSSAAPTTSLNNGRLFLPLNN